MRHGPARLATVGLALGLASSGCFLWTSASEGEALRQRTQEAERRLAALEKRIEEDRSALVAELRERSAELSALVDRATQVVTRNSADVTVEVQQLRERLDALEGRIAEVRHATDSQRSEWQAARAEIEARIDQVAIKAGLDVPLRPGDVPESRTDHYAAAYRAYQGAARGPARALFREYIRRYPRDDNADNAQYWIGMTYVAQERPAAALAEFRRVLSEYPSGDALDETLFEMGEAFLRMRACTDARAAWQGLVDNQPDSPLRDRARNRLRELQRMPRGQCAS
ncbi:MAG: tetratricopeptide repeat protein [Myxococcales bacterium]|nr:tetratricopeptide repeat protein [Myxococcales bacterium]